MARHASVSSALTLLMLGAWACASEPEAASSDPAVTLPESICTRSASFLAGVSTGELPFPCVSLPNGEFEGIWVVDHVRAFLGIRYAEPPTGEARWAPPRPVEKHHREAYEANRFPGRCPQPPSTEPANIESEDCLFLNVWTPTDAKKRPVMVWIHGGGNVNGYGSEWVYDGQHFAARHDVVLVSINYRLGVFGFFAPAALSVEGEGIAGNQGLWDQVLALEWVRDNIERFGGDPDNVTIFGESAGAADVCMLVASPRARGLFHRAISQSGGCTTRRSSLESAQRMAAAFAERVGCKDHPQGELACMRARSIQELVDAASVSGAISAGGIVDGVFMPEQPRALFDRGEIAKVPYMLGSTTDEGSYWTLNDTGITNDEQYLEVLRRRFTEPIEPIAQMYPASKFERAKNPYQAALTRAWGDGRLVCSTQDVAVRADAAGSPVFNYNYDIPVDDVIGAAHASELVLVFGTAINFTPETMRVSERMMRYWTNFARTGDPNGEGLFEWPRWEPATNVRINFGVESTLAPDFRGPECALWRARYDQAFAQP